MRLKYKLLASFLVISSGPGFAQSLDYVPIEELADDDSVSVSEAQAIAQQKKRFRNIASSEIANATMSASENAVSDTSSSSTDDNSNDNSVVQVGAIGITGAENIDVKAFSSIIEPALGSEKTQEDLSKLTRDIADLARDEGFLFASAFIPEQSMKMGVLEIRLNEGRLDEIRIIGSDNDYIRRVLTPLEGRVARKAEIERLVLIASDSPSIYVRSTEFLQEEGKNILQLTVSDLDNDYGITADNYGSERYGPIRARLYADVYNIATDADDAGISVRTNPFEPDELANISGYYSTQVGTGGLRLGIAGSYGKNQPGADFSGTDLRGNSLYMGAFGSYPVIRRPQGSLWIEAEASYLEISRDFEGTRFRQDKTTTLGVGVRGEIPVFSGRIRAGASVETGLDIFGTTREGDPLASLNDGDGVFTVGEYWTDFRTEILPKLSTYVAAKGQIASRPLLSAQEIGIGGAYRVRGYDFNELSGDEGFYGLAELRYSFSRPASWMRRLQLYGFFDGGHVNDFDGDFGEGTLLSAGPGMRGALGPLDFEIETAFPINRDRDESDDKSPHLNVRVGFDF